MPPAEQLRQSLRTQLKTALWTLLVMMTLCSVGAGMHNALAHSQDFQWSGAHLLRQHVDPWAEYLRGDPGRRLIVTQIPNYLAVLYVLLLPLGSTEVHTANVVWMGCNVFFAIASGVLAARANGLRGKAVLGVVCLLLMATAARNTIGNGQQGLLVLFLWCAALPLWTRSANGGAALAGVSYLKFSFAPPMFLYLLFRWGVRAALLSLTPAGAALVLVWLWLAGAHHPALLLKLAMEPMQVAHTGFTTLAGDQDLMYLVEAGMRLNRGVESRGLALAAALAVCVPVSYMAFRVHRGRSTAWHMAVLATMSYGLFKHHAYDGVVLLFPLCYALGRWREGGARLVLLLIGYLFYGQRVLEAMHLRPQWCYVVELAMLMTILGAVYRMQEQAAQTAVAIPFPRATYDPVTLAG